MFTRNGCGNLELKIARYPCTEAVKLVLQLKVGGLLWMGVECSSFVWANSSKCRRTPEHPCGDTTYPKVVELVDGGAPL